MDPRFQLKQQVYSLWRAVPNKWYSVVIIDFSEESRTYNLEFVDKSRTCGVLAINMKLPSEMTSLEMASVVDIDTDCCCVCRGSLGGELIACEGCSIWVHSTCYGNMRVPEEDWYCQRCTADRVARRKPAHDCIACGTTEPGICLFLAVPSEVAKRANGAWVHVSCAHNLDGLRIEWSADPNVPGGIVRGWESPLLRDHFKLNCSLCAEAKGACVQCRICDADNAGSAFSPGISPGDELSDAAKVLIAAAASPGEKHVQEEAFLREAGAAWKSICDTDACINAFHVPCAFRHGLSHRYVEADAVAVESNKASYFLCRGHSVKFEVLLAKLRGTSIPREVEAHVINTRVHQPSKGSVWREKLYGSPGEWLLSLYKYLEKKRQLKKDKESTSATETQSVTNGSGVESPSSSATHAAAAPAPSSSDKQQQRAAGSSADSESAANPLRGPPPAPAAPPSNSAHSVVAGKKRPSRGDNTSGRSTEVSLIPPPPSFSATGRNAKSGSKTTAAAASSSSAADATLHDAADEHASWIAGLANSLFAAELIGASFLTSGSTSTCSSSSSSNSFSLGFTESEYSSTLTQIVDMSTRR